MPDSPVERPSGLEARAFARGVAMRDGDSADAIAAFARAAGDAERLGFHTIERHGAHGYPLDQFFWAATNRRTERCGGASIGECARCAAEVVAVARARVGADVPIILRLSQWKVPGVAVRLAETLALMGDWLTPLVEAGGDVLHCSQRRFREPPFPDIDDAQGQTSPAGPRR